MDCGTPTSPSHPPASSGLSLHWSPWACRACPTTGRPAAGGGSWRRHTLHFNILLLYLEDATLLMRLLTINK